MILVVGSTGLVGSQITRGLLDRGHEVRILVRPSSNYEPFVVSGAQHILGDLKEPSSLAPALDGVDVVISTASAGQRGGADSPRSVDFEGNRNLINAARAAGVNQFIFVSALAADENSPAELPRFKALTEAYLRASNVTYTILAANAIADVLLSLVVTGPLRAGKPVTLVGEGRRRHSFVTTRDIAAFAIASFEHPAALNQRIVLAGPEAFSWWDVLAAYERELGHDIAVEKIRPGDLLPDLPPVPGLAEFVSGLMAELETFDSQIDMSETAHTFGVRQTSYDDFVRQEAAGILATTAGATF